MPVKMKGSKVMKTAEKTMGLSVPVYVLAGPLKGEMELPEEVFGVQVNKALLSQALRVYQTNRSAHHSHSKTRGEVSGSTVKIWRQKGTGRARHGARTAPIFVGGGIALGPKFRKTVLTLPRKMKHVALKSAFALKTLGHELLGIEDLDKASGKTAEFAKFLAKLQKRSVLFVAENQIEGARRAVRNLPGASFLPVGVLSVYDVMRHQSLILTRGAVERLYERLGKKVDVVSSVREQELSVSPAQKKGLRRLAKA